MSVRMRISWLEIEKSEGRMTRGGRWIASILNTLRLGNSLPWECLAPASKEDLLNWLLWTTAAGMKEDEWRAALRSHHRQRSRREPSRGRDQLGKERRETGAQSWGPLPVGGKGRKVNGAEAERQAGARNQERLGEHRRRPSAVEPTKVG